jgi:hypothetical protein
MYKSHVMPEQQPSGLHLLHLNANDGDEAPAQHVWQGDARSCLAWDSGSGDRAGSGGSPAVGLAVGAEPADVFASLDGGASWTRGTDSFSSAPSRPTWSFPPPPHIPHVLSIERLPANAVDGLEEGKQAAQAESQQGSKQFRLVAGIEVGGVMVSGAFDGVPAQLDGALSGDAWQERTGEGLYPDGERLPGPGRLGYLNSVSCCDRTFTTGGLEVRICLP